MEFKKVSIGDYAYGRDGGLAEKEGEPDFDRADDQQDLLSDTAGSARNDGSKVVRNFNFYDPEFEEHLKDQSHPNHKNIVNFLLHMALCHTIVIQRKKVEIERNTPRQPHVEDDSDRSNDIVREMYSA